MLGLNFSLHKPPNRNFSALFGLKIFAPPPKTLITMKMPESKLPLTIVVAPESCIMNRQIRVKVSKFLVVSGPLPTGYVTQRVHIVHAICHVHCTIVYETGLNVTTYNGSNSRHMMNRDTLYLSYC